MKLKDKIALAVPLEQLGLAAELLLDVRKKVDSAYESCPSSFDYDSYHIMKIDISRTWNSINDQIEHFKDVMKSETRSEWAMRALFRKLGRVL